MQKRLTFAEYLAIDAVNWSTLKHLLKSPLHYEAAKTAPNVDTAARLLGRASHTSTLEPDRLPREYAVWEGGDRRLKEWKDKWATFKEANKAKAILEVDEYEQALAIRDAVRRHPVAAPLLAEGEAEVTLQWTDLFTKLACKGRVDWIGPRHVVDLKTSRHATDPRAFAADAFRLGYFHQLAFYRAGARRQLGRVLKPVIIAVENAPPYDVAVYELHAEALEAADEQVGDLLKRLTECRTTNRWPGVFAEPQLLNLPRWAFPSETDGMDFMKEAG